MIGKHLLDIDGLSASDIRRILSTASRLKADWREGRRDQYLSGKVLGMLFQKPSLRTRVSFEVAMRQLGGYAMYLSPNEVQMGQRESVSDVARVLSRFVDCIMARVFHHSEVEELAAYATVPVINGLSDASHPCQALADLLTIQEKKGRLEGLTIAFVGDGDNNVAHSLMFGAARLGMHFAVASPTGYAPNERMLALARPRAAASGGSIRIEIDPRKAVVDADIIYTDVWTSMGQEAEREQRLAAFAPYQVNERLLSAAKPDALVMHDLPAHRGEEITDDVMDGPRSVVFDQAENRLHAQKAVLFLILASGEA